LKQLTFESTVTKKHIQYLLQLDSVGAFFTSDPSNRKLVWFYQTVEDAEASTRRSSNASCMSSAQPPPSSSLLLESGLEPVNIPGGSSGTAADAAGTGTGMLPPVASSRFGGAGGPGGSASGAGARGGVGAMRARGGQSSTPAIRKKLFLTDGCSLPLTGVCIYALKINPDKNITEDNIPKVYIDINYVHVRNSHIEQPSFINR
jgi:hypothetical protein